MNKRRRTWIQRLFLCFVQSFELLGEIEKVLQIVFGLSQSETETVVDDFHADFDSKRIDDFLDLLIESLLQGEFGIGLHIVEAKTFLE